MLKTLLKKWFVSWKTNKLPRFLTKTLLGSSNINAIQ
ncbi:hypothetical protein J3R74_003904 [Puniceicoccus vermicola]